MRLSARDPRLKLLILLAVSSAALFTHNPSRVLAVLCLTVLILFCGGVSLARAWADIRRMLGLIFMLFVIQCLFNRSGAAFVGIGGFTLVTENGFTVAALVSLRLVVILLSALIVGTGEIRDYLLALTQCKIPYEIAFMVLAALRFIPMLREEAQDVLCAVQMRGIKLHKTGLKHKLRVYGNVLIPIVAGAIHRSEQLAIAMEARAFRAYPQRTSMRALTFTRQDSYYLGGFIIALSVIIIIF